MAGASEQGAKLDTAAKKLGLGIFHVQAFEGEPAVMNGVLVPSASAWAFGGARVGETSDLFDDDQGYFMVRLDSIREGGDAKLENVKADVRARVAVQQQIDKLVPMAQQDASAAATSTLESAAQQANRKVEKTSTFARSSLVPGLGQFTEAIGAAFGLPTGAVSAPVKTGDGVYVIRVDKRVVSDSTAWAAQKEAQKTARLQQLRQQKIQMFLQDLKKAAKIDDRRKQINAATRRAEVV
jgi:peptidyl-prolyl cis-trans isomerase D